MEEQSNQNVRNGIDRKAVTGYSRLLHYWETFAAGFTVIDAGSDIEVSKLDNWIARNRH